MWVLSKIGICTRKEEDFEAILTRFASDSEKSHDETNTTIRDQQDLMSDQQDLMRNQQDSIFNIELAKQFNERLLGGLPSNTEQNPKGLTST